MDLHNKIKVGLVNIDTNNNLPKCQEIIDKIANKYGFNSKHLKGRRRKVEDIWPRHTAMTLCRLLGVTYQQVGEAFGKDHGTVINACQNVQNLCDTEPRLRAEFEDLKELVGL